MTMIDTREGINFAKAAARAGALDLEVKSGLKRRGQTAYSIVKEVYGFRGSRESVLADINEYVEAELRLRKLPDGVGTEVSKHTQEVVDRLDGDEQLTQANFEQFIYEAEIRGAISHAFRQAMSDLFYVTIVRNIARNR